MKLLFTLLIFFFSFAFADSIKESFYKTQCEDNKSKVRELACNELAKIYYANKDYKKAKVYFTTACDANMSKACYELSAIYYQGLGVDKNMSIGNEFSIKACSLGNAEACHSVGYMYSVGLKIPKVDKLRALTYLKKACRDDIPVACRQTADIYSNSNLKKIYNINSANKFYLKAINSFKQGCQRGNSFSCSFLGKIYYLGNYSNRDYKKAKEYFKKSCKFNQNNGGCNSIAYIYFDSKEKSLDEIALLLKEGCNFKFGLACALMGDIYLKKGDKKRAIEFYNRALVGSLELANGYNVLYDFNLFLEVSIILNKEFNQELVDKYLRAYKDYDSYLINYKILKLFKDVSDGKNPDIDKFIKSYRGIKLYKADVGYKFSHLKVWIDNLEDKEKKSKLLKLYSTIKREFF